MSDHPAESPPGEAAAPSEGETAGPHEIHGVEDATLGGYLRVHERPPAFEGSDGHPYTVSIEVEKTPDLRSPYRGYLVFPRWAQTGVGIVGHRQTGLLWSGTTRADVEETAGRSTLDEVQEFLEGAIRNAVDDRDPEERDWEC
jgi:hypothetical protein